MLPGDVTESCLNTLLEMAPLEDYGPNGLQVEGSGEAPA